MIERIEKILIKVGQDLNIDIAQGNCLNFAIAATEAFGQIGVELNVLLVMRTVDGEGDGWLSHAVVYAGSVNSAFFDDKKTLDHLGTNAFTRWSSVWNEVQISNGNEEEEFWLERINMPNADYLKFAMEEFGCTEEGKLVDNAQLRELVKNKIKSHKLFNELKLLSAYSPSHF